MHIHVHISSKPCEVENTNCVKNDPKEEKEEEKEQREWKVMP